MQIDLRQGNCLDVMKTLKDNSVDAIVTDPPYGLSFMGKKWDYDVPSVKIWEECLRVLKHGGYLLSFAGTRTQHRMACNIEDAGFEIRDMIAWVYGSGFPKSLNIGKAVDKLQGNKGIITNQKTYPDIRNNNYNNSHGKTRLSGGDYSAINKEHEGWGTALKPALEPITVARKPLSEKTVAENVLKWGTGGINIDGCRVEKQDGDRTEYGVDGIKRKNNNNVYGKQSGEIQFDGTQGRFPANLIHDGSDEVVELFPNSKSSNAVRKNNGKQDDKTYGKYNAVDSYGFTDSGSAARFFYCAKASKAERNMGCEGLEEKERVDYGGFHSEKGLIENNRNPENRKPTTNNHPTVKPIALMEYLVKLVSRENATVLDPFLGSGTTGIACKNLDRNFIGIELDEDYLKIAEKRINNREINNQQLELFITC